MPAQELLAQLREVIPDVNVEEVQLRDPSDHSEVFQCLGPLLQRLSTATSVDVLLSSGTPQMQTIWLVLVKAGLLRARMLQVIPAAFVPSVHPRAVREVNLQIDGFPEIIALREEVSRLRGMSGAQQSVRSAKSPAMKKLARRIGRVAPSDLPVLIYGETGSGKELVARAVHAQSQRSGGPLISENCGALTESVLSSELFGHEKGAFTGAAYRKRGLFELAHGGTLFLDEVGELSPRVQVNLLRVLQEGRLKRLGGETHIRVDVRVVAATHRDLLAMVREGSFREDLYYRLQGATLNVPPLRERISDLDALVSEFLGEVNSDLRVTKQAWQRLEEYGWPGNVRELRTEVMRWHVFCDQWVRPEDLHLQEQPTLLRAEKVSVNSVRPLAEAVSHTERLAIEAALANTQGNLSQAARLLQIDRNTLKRKIAKLSIG